MLEKALIGSSFSSCSPDSRIFSIADNSRIYSVTKTRWDVSRFSTAKVEGAPTAKATARQIRAAIASFIFGLSYLPGFYHVYVLSRDTTVKRGAQWQPALLSRQL